MNRTFSLRFVTALTLSLPALGLANLDQTLTLQANKALNFDTGATANAGLDILWNGASMAPQRAMPQRSSCTKTSPRNSIPPSLRLPFSCFQATQKLRSPKLA